MYIFDVKSTISALHILYVDLTAKVLVAIRFMMDLFNLCPNRCLFINFIHFFMYVDKCFFFTFRQTCTEAILLFCQ